MKRLSFLLILVLTFFFSSFGITSASLVKVDKNGEVIINVLSYEDSLALKVPQSDSLSIKKLAVSGSSDQKAEIRFSKEGEKTQLAVISNEGESRMDVSSIQGEIVEIEERPQVRKIEIGISEEKFSIKQDNVTALTSYPITVDAKKAELTLSTPSGSRFLAVLPKEAVDNLLEHRIISSLLAGNKINLEEEGQGVLTYIIEGEKSVNIFNLVNYTIPVKAKLSAVNGEILSVEQPVWYKLLNFLFIS